MALHHNIDNIIETVVNYSERPQQKLKNNK